MYLAYLDDSDTKAKSNKWQVVAAVVVKDDMLKMARTKMSAASEVLLGKEQSDSTHLPEFHACELYGGYKAFDGIEQNHRFAAIGYLLRMLTDMNMSVIYGAVNLDEHKKNIYGSADPVDVCFRKCVAHIEQWTEIIIMGGINDAIGNEEPNSENQERIKLAVLENVGKGLVILIADECDGKTKNTLQQSFRNLGRTGPLGCFHDDMFFGDSRYSSGIQLADLCAYFIARHLEGDASIEDFYQMIEPRLFPARIANQQNNLEILAGLAKELGDGSKEPGVQEVREGDGSSPVSESENSENSDGGRETRTGDAASANG